MLLSLSHSPALGSASLSWLHPSQTALQGLRGSLIGLAQVVCLVLNHPLFPEGWGILIRWEEVRPL